MSQGGRPGFPAVPNTVTVHTVHAHVKQHQRRSCLWKGIDRDRDPRGWRERERERDGDTEGQRQRETETERNRDREREKEIESIPNATLSPPE